MNICVAIRAMSTYVFEDQVRVALGTCHFLVHAAQRIAGVVMIELRIRANRFPACVGVTFLAWNGDGAMGIRYLGLGTAHAGPRTVGGLLQSSSGEQGDKSNKNRSKPARTYHLSLRVFQGPAPVTTGVETDRLCNQEPLKVLEPPGGRSTHSPTDKVRQRMHSQLTVTQITGTQFAGIGSPEDFWRGRFSNQLASTMLRGLPLTGIKSGFATV